jgi:hypothetical protein
LKGETFNGIIIEPVKKSLKTTATLVLVAVSFVVLAEAFCCAEEETQAAGAPVECCLQCCPRHHLAPPAVHPVPVGFKPSFEKFLMAESTLHPVLFVDSIFHPPRA